MSETTSSPEPSREPSSEPGPEPRTDSFSEPATGPIPAMAAPVAGPPYGYAPPPPPPPARRSSRVNLVAAWVGIVAGIVFIVAVIFGTGFMLGASSGDRHHRGEGGPGRGDAMVHRQAPPPGFQMGPMLRPGPGFIFPEGPMGPGGPMGPNGPRVPGGPDDSNQSPTPGAPSQPR